MFWWLLFFGICAFVVFQLVQPAEQKSGGSLEEYFVDANVTGVPSTKAKKGSDTKYKQAYTVPGRQLLILYGTEYGFSEDLAKKLFDLIGSLSADLQLQPRLVNMRDHAALDFVKETVALIVCSTTGDGVPPTDAKPFFDWLEEEANQKLENVRFSILALGDSNYPHYCSAGRTLDAFLEKAGAKRVIPRSDVDQEDWDVINKWMDAVSAMVVDLAPSLPIETDYWVPVMEDPDAYSRVRPYMADVTLKTTLTTEKCDKDKEVIHVEFDLKDSGLVYLPGDALGIYPVNKPEEVDALLAAMHANGKDRVPVPTSAALQSTMNVTDDGTSTLFEVLSSGYDLRTVRPELIKGIADSLPEGEHKAHATTLLSGGLSVKENSALATFLDDREVIDVVEDLCGTNPLSASVLLTHLRPLQPRYYSISSSPSISKGKVTATVATVRYELRKRARTGVCSTYLSDRVGLGGKVPLFISANHNFRLPKDPTTPIIMIGPGTGLAPFRAFLQERTNDPIDPTELHHNGTAATNGLAKPKENGLVSLENGHGAHANGDTPLENGIGQSSEDLPTNVFFFGCRNRDHDFLYRQQLERLDKEGKVKLILAFSREGTQKVYVQHRIKEHAAMLWALLQKGAHIYVCGDATHMAKDVHTALVDMAVGIGGMQRGEVEAYMTALEKEGRYEKDVWAT
eukprot:comp20798_c0_seq1/m.27359 comp20798_c0_seq1/g.27359  ORF comp20798_c0_seq1/g.27359 comp20798_c0_seq1/m.27359 type:complete len:683 (-) comp20798_c0_seq1:208-2256(-)